jgi:hypothetical protein
MMTIFSLICPLAIFPIERSSFNLRWNHADNQQEELMISDWWILDLQSLINPQTSDFGQNFGLELDVKDPDFDNRKVRLFYPPVYYYDLHLALQSAQETTDFLTTKYCIDSFVSDPPGIAKVSRIANHNSS